MIHSSVVILVWVFFCVLLRFIGRLCRVSAETCILFRSGRLALYMSACYNITTQATSSFCNSSQHGEKSKYR
jgi:hypothetical protein